MKVKLEAMWNFLIKTRHLNDMLPALEAVLGKVRRQPALGIPEHHPETMIHTTP